MKRVVIIGRGGAGKSTLARKLGNELGLPVVELDKVFWINGTSPAKRSDWSAVHRELIGQDSWIIDGDLGPYDWGLADRLAAADAVLLLDFPMVTCALRVLKRERENWEFWRWMTTYRRRSLPGVLKAIEDAGASRKVLWFRSQGQVDRYVAALSSHA